MNRRDFISLCGAAGLGMIIGLAPAQPARAMMTDRPLPDYRRKPVWMRGSAKTGCARLPIHERPDLELDLPAVV